ncbi:hypothetical protein PhaeoP75_01114 [Phaeobacter gallaeciensis]|uniref:phage protein Gp27 family protein n=1 Tax=Phaeobacter gallaeciensis TaxID=60890 RepID=UPI000BBCA6A7|nr:phage protein Gp27 family protein [Phaeobacter gallaeciensis]ATF00773.1 hypothetical protein PhaeoP75_01114 [Phaeobacter gallaeciensis]
MPPPRKVDLLPADLRRWLQDELKTRGFSGYEDIAEALNFRLEEEGVTLRVHRASVQRFGQEYQEFVKYQEEAGAWAADWINSQGLEDEANRHGVLFQMLTTLAFKFMKDQMVEGQEIDPKELHFIGRMMKDIMASSGLREKMMEAERSAQSDKLDQAVAAGEIDKAAAEKAREIMGFG